MKNYDPRMSFGEDAAAEYPDDARGDEEAAVNNSSNVALVYGR